MPDGTIEIRQPGERGVDATLVLNFGDDTVAEVMDVTFQPPGDVDRGMGLLADLVAAGNLLMKYSKSPGGGV
jgi:hypothetical protein